MNFVGTSGKKHETLPKGGFEYVDFKNCGNHDGIPSAPAQNLNIKMSATKTRFAHKSAQGAPIAMILVSVSMFLRPMTCETSTNMFVVNF